MINLGDTFKCLKNGMTGTVVRKLDNGEYETYLYNPQTNYKGRGLLTEEELQDKNIWEHVGTISLEDLSK